MLQASSILLAQGDMPQMASGNPSLVDKILSASRKEAWIRRVSKLVWPKVPQEITGSQVQLRGS